MQKFARQSPPVVVCLMLVLACGAVLAQTSNSNGQYPAREPSRAARQASELVSLSADSILAIFRDSPGLVLAFKRTLVVKAYEQGRLLDPENLSDDAVFELVRNDIHVRVLATQEIEKRSYIRAKIGRAHV